MSEQDAIFGQIALKLGFTTRQQLDDALAELVKRQMKPSSDRDGVERSAGVSPAEKSLLSPHLKKVGQVGISGRARRRRKAEKPASARCSSKWAP